MKYLSRPHINYLIEYNDVRKVRILHLILDPKISKIPSSSNQKFIAKNHGKFRIINAPKFQSELALIFYSLNTLPPLKLGMKDDRYFCLILASSSCSRCDSHNLTKPVCDLLQKANIISNDKFIDALCLHKVDWLEKDSQIDSTEIFLFSKRELDALLISLKVTIPKEGGTQKIISKELTQTSLVQSLVERFKTMSCKVSSS